MFIIKFHAMKKEKEHAVLISNSSNCSDKNEEKKKKSFHRAVVHLSNESNRNDKFGTTISSDASHTNTPWNQPVGLALDDRSTPVGVTG